MFSLRKVQYFGLNIIVFSVFSFGILLSFQNCSSGFSTYEDSSMASLGTHMPDSQMNDPFVGHGGAAANPPATNGGAAANPPATNGGAAVNPPATNGGAAVNPPATNGGAAVNPRATNGGAGAHSPVGYGGAGAISPPSLPQHTFRIIANVSSNAVYSYNVSLAIDLNAGDISTAAPKYVFLVGEINGMLHVYSPISKKWVVYSDQLNMAQYSLALPTNMSQFPFTFYDLANADLVGLGGSKFFAGYGIGSAPSAAAAEMLSFRDSRHPNGRYDFFYEVPKQGHAVNIQVSSQSSPAKVSATASVFVRYESYNQTGFFFFAAQDPTTKTILLYDGTTWQPTTSNASISGLTQLSNRTFTMVADVSLSAVAGWNLFAGYGVGATSSAAFQHLLDNKLYNQSPYVIPTTGETQASAANWSVSGVASGSLSSLSVVATIQVADAHINKTGYQFMVAMVADGAGPIPMVYRVTSIPNQSRWVRWDGVLAGFPAPGPLHSTSRSGVTLASYQDVTALGGTKVYAGYGVGDSIAAAASEMMTSSRFREIYSIPQQPFSAQVSIPNFLAVSPAPGPASPDYVISFRVYPSYLHYGQPGRYYIAAIAPDGSIFANNGSQWLKYDGNSNTETLHYKKVESLSNVEFTLEMSGSALTSYTGFRLTTGYGLTFTDFISNSRWANPVVIQPTR
jgi:hypothetical protein